MPQELFFRWETTIQELDIANRVIYRFTGQLRQLHFVNQYHQQLSC
jgi:hypothetical protein